MPNLVRLGILYLAAVTLLFAAWRTPETLRYLGERGDEARAFQPEYRSIAPAVYLDISREFALQARNRLGPDSTYAVLTGSNVGVSNDIVLGAVAGLMPYVLLPRRQVPFDEAEWILCYGCERSELPRQARVVWEGEDGGLAIAVVRS